MKIPTNNYPIPFRESWLWNDATKLKCFSQCPRKYFWQFVMCWHKIGSAGQHHLDFGTALHEVVQYILINRDKILNHSKDIRARLSSRIEFVQSLTEASIEFADWLVGRKIFDSYQESKKSFPKTRDRLRQAALLYIHSLQYSSNELLSLCQVEVLSGTITQVPAIEIPGEILFLGKYRIKYRIDSILQHPRGCFVNEIKTSGLSPEGFSNQWPMDIQANLYNYVWAEKCWEMGINFIPTRIDGFIFKKTRPASNRKMYQEDIKNPFRHVELKRFWTTWAEKDRKRFKESLISKCLRIEEEFNHLHGAHKEETLPAFPMNETNCHNQYGRVCSYFKLCRFIERPLEWREPPNGFEFREWNPDDL